MAYRTEVVAEFRVPFTFTSGTLVLQQVFAGGILDGAWVRIDTLFDDPTATITMGTGASPDAVFGPGDVFPGFVNQYTSQTFEDFLAPDTLSLVIAPAASTQGSGVLVYRYRS